MEIQVRRGRGDGVTEVRETGVTQGSGSVWTAHARERRSAQQGQGRTYVPHGFVERPEGGLLVVVEDAPVPVQDGHALALSLSAVAAVHAVIRAVVPLAGEQVETLCGDRGTGALSPLSPGLHPYPYPLSPWPARCATPPGTGATATGTKFQQI